jgi:hypothetical protein
MAGHRHTRCDEPSTPSDGLKPEPSPARPDPITVGGELVQWTQCPQCGLPAEVVDRDVWPSTEGPIEHVHVRCVEKHRFVMPAAPLELHHQDISSQPSPREPATTRRHGNHHR